MFLLPRTGVEAVGTCRAWQVLVTLRSWIGPVQEGKLRRWIRGEVD